MFKRQNPENSKREVDHRAQEVLDGIVSLFLIRNFEGQRQRANIYIVLKGKKKNVNQESCIQQKWSFKSEGEMSTFPK